MDSLPYLAEPRIVESLVDDLSSKGHNIHDIVRELERMATRSSANEAPLLTDIRILTNSLRRLLASRQRK